MYYPFKRPLVELDFTDIDDFCRQGIAENLFLDYKEELKAEKIAKNIASFANTKGGIILVGVHEDKQIKQPSAWDGIASNGTMSEQVNAIVANVVPYPVVDFAIIDIPHQGRSYVVIQVEPGMLAPYFTVHNPIIWIRTGDITGQVDQANRTDLFALTKRGTAADLKIKDSLLLADQLFLERHRRARSDQNTSPGFASIDRTAADHCDIPMVVCNIIPRNPDEITTHQNLYEQRINSRYDKPPVLIPDMNIDLTTTRHGIVSRNEDAFDIGNRLVRYYYINKFGLLQSRRELVDTVNGQTGMNILAALRTVQAALRYASSMYSYFNYSGLLRLEVQLVNLDKSAYLNGTYDPFSEDRSVRVDLDCYDWSYDIGTHELTTESTQKILQKLYTQIYLDVGFNHVSREALKMIEAFTI